MTKRVGIIGAGAVGLAMAVEYSLAGHEVVLGEVKGFADRLPENGCIHYQGLTFADMKTVALSERQVRIAGEYADFNRAKCEVVFVVTTAHPHERLLKDLNEILAPDIPIIVICGNGSAVAAHLDRPIVESNSAPYGVRVVSRDGGNPAIAIKILTPKFGISGTPGSLVAALPFVQAVYSEAFAYGHELDALFSNPNPLMHVSIMLANLTRLDQHKRFTFYDEGVGESVLRIVRAKDVERMLIAEAAGLMPTAFNDFEGVIDIEGMLVTQHFLECGKISQLLAPNCPDDRYFSEDAPYGLIPWEGIAAHMNLQARIPIITGEIELVSIVLQENLRHQVASRNTAIINALSI